MDRYSYALFMLLAPLVFVACLAFEINPFRGVAVCWQLFDSLRGLRIVIEDARAPIAFYIV